MKKLSSMSLPNQVKFPAPVGHSDGQSGGSATGVELKRVDQLRANPLNARTHSEHQLKLIAKSIKRFGFINPVLIDSSGQIIAGHGRVEAARQLGHKRVPVLHVEHLNGADLRAYVLADNKLAELASWSRETLSIEFRALLEIGYDA